jgi:hypothetical protein
VASKGLAGGGLRIYGKERGYGKNSGCVARKGLRGGKSFMLGRTYSIEIFFFHVWKIPSRSGKFVRILRERTPRKLPVPL